MGGPDFVMCPLVDKEIENIDCIENSDAVDGIIKKETIPERFKTVSYTHLTLPTNSLV